jgi:hypothetical protein
VALGLPLSPRSLTREQVRLSGGGSDAPNGVMSCGATEALRVQTADGGAGAARRMVGNEALVARLFTPTGVAEALPLQFVESTGRCATRAREESRAAELGGHPKAPSGRASVHPARPPARAEPGCR